MLHPELLSFADAGIEAELAGPQQQDSTVAKQKRRRQFVFAKHLPVVYIHNHHHRYEQRNSCQAGKQAEDQ